MKPKKIWLVSHGEYSDYSVDSAFSTPEKAAAFAKVMNGQEDTGDYGVEEFDVDAGPEYPSGLSPFVVNYWEKNGNIAHPDDPSWYAYVGLYPSDQQDKVGGDYGAAYAERYGFIATFFCLAHNNEHALKIGQERLQKITAQAAADRGEV